MAPCGRGFQIEGAEIADVPVLLCSLLQGSTTRPATFSQIANSVHHMVWGLLCPTSWGAGPQVCVCGTGVAKLRPARKFAAGILWIPEVLYLSEVYSGFSCSRGITRPTPSKMGAQQLFARAVGIRGSYFACLGFHPFLH